MRIGAVSAGAAIELPEVPQPVLRTAPLVDGQWLDDVGVELAEYGALLDRAGYRFGPPLDEHVFAWGHIVAAEPSASSESVEIDVATT